KRGTAPLPLSYQRLLGNRGTQQLPGVQAKQRVSQPHDADEREADRVADHVMRMQVSAQLTEGDVEVRRKCAVCKHNDEEVLRRKPIAENTVPSSSASILESSGLSGGSPLDAQTRNFFEPRFGLDLSQVRLHSGVEADRAARNVNALAFTIGNDV